MATDRDRFIKDVEEFMMEEVAGKKETDAVLEAIAIIKIITDDDTDFKYSKVSNIFKLKTKSTFITLDRNPPYRISIQTSQISHQFTLSDLLFDRILIYQLLADSLKEISNSAADIRVHEIIEIEHQKTAIAIQKESERLEASYLEKLKLDEPREIWAKKSGAHDKKAKIAEASFTILSIATVMLLVITPLLIVIEYFNVKNAGNLQTIDTKYVAFIASLTVTALMLITSIIRNQYKRMMDERHLANDAMERATMVDTYNAMHAQGLVTKRDRKKIIDTLFAPTTIPDHPEGVHHPVEFIAKFAGNTAGKAAKKIKKKKAA